MNPGALLRRAFALDTRSLAVFRIGAACVLLADVAGRFGVLRDFHTDHGVLPRSAVLAAPGVEFPSAYFATGSSVGAAILLALAGVAAIALLAGWHTRVATIASWFLFASAAQRNPTVLHGGDALLRAMLFWAMFLPLGARWSLDARRAGPPAPATVIGLAPAAYLLQLAWLYWLAALNKVGPAWLTRGDALLLALNFDQLVTPLGLWLKAQPPVLLQALTRGAWLLEAVGPFLLFVSMKGRLRVVAVGLFTLLHLGFGAALSLGTFVAIPIVCWVATLPGWCWEGRRADGPAGNPAEAEVVPRSLVLQALVAVALIVAAWAGAGRVGLVSLPALVKVAERVSGLEQRWVMFAPTPRQHDGWWVARAFTAAGDTVDLARGGARASLDKPRDREGLMRNGYWRVYLIYLINPSLQDARPWLSRYFCREGGRLGHGAMPERLELFFVLEWTRPEGRSARPAPLLLEARQCADTSSAWVALPQISLPGLYATP
ncbi:MAG: HTTM domain-containing protein [Gemmatimonadales bacterium]